MGPSSPTEWIASLDSESYYQRRVAQNALEKLGSAGAQAVLDALARAELTARGRLHAVWILAHIRGRAATDLLFDLAASDPEAAVRGQAVRALADLHDPVKVIFLLNLS